MTHTNENAFLMKNILYLLKHLQLSLEREKKNLRACCFCYGNMGGGGSWAINPQNLLFPSAMYILTKNQSYKTFRRLFSKRLV